MAVYNNSNWGTLYCNFRKSQRKWVMLANVMGKTGVDIKARVMMYKAIVQAVLMYGIEIWMFTYATMKFLEGFHHSI